METSASGGPIVLKNIRRDIPALKPLAAKVILLQRQLIEAVQRYQVRPLILSLQLFSFPRSNPPLCTAYTIAEYSERNEEREKGHK